MRVLVLRKCIVGPQRHRDECNDVADVYAIVETGMEPKDALQDTIQRLDRMKSDEDHTRLTNESRVAASSLGSPTPMTLLCDIRSELETIRREVVDTNTTLLKYIKQRQDDDADVVASARQRDDDVNKILKSLADVTLSQQRPSSQYAETSRSSTPMSPRSYVPSKQDYFYMSKRIATNWDVVACIMCQLDALIAINVVPDNIPDLTVMEFNTWVAMCKDVCKTASTCTLSQGVLDMPKVNHPEMSLCRTVIGSTAQGLVSRFTLENLVKICDECPAVMSTINEVRLRLVKCQGLIGRSRTRRMLSVNYPFVTQAGDLNIAECNDMAIGSKAVLDAVAGFRTTQKNREMYITEVLTNRRQPMAAANFVVTSKARTS